MVPIEQALGIARESGLDLVEVDPNGAPPVCRVLDYGKYKYQQAKRERDARKHQKGGMIHEVRMRPRIGRADMERKVHLAERLLSEGDKVKVAVMFRGREMSHPEVGREVLDRALESLKEVAIMERSPVMEGRALSVILTPNTKKPAPAAKAAEEAPVEDVILTPNAKKPAPTAKAKEEAPVEEKENAPVEEQVG